MCERVSGGRAGRVRECEVYASPECTCVRHFKRFIGNVGEGTAIYMELHTGSQHDVDPKMKFVFSFPEKRSCDVALDHVAVHTYIHTYIHTYVRGLARRGIYSWVLLSIRGRN